MKRGSLYLLLSFLITLSDQLTKDWVLDNLNMYQHYPIFWGLNFTPVLNRGISFSLFNFINDWLHLLLIFFIFAISLFLGLLILFAKRKSLTHLLGLSFVLGGALGNLVDRLFLGYIIDFIHIEIFNYFHFPIFNLADIFITCGGILILISILADKKRVDLHK